MSAKISFCRKAAAIVWHDFASYVILALSAFNQLKKHKILTSTCYFNIPKPKYKGHCLIFKKTLAKNENIY